MRNQWFPGTRKEGNREGMLICHGVSFEGGKILELGSGDGSTTLQIH
jgi:hypothetical protein